MSPNRAAALVLAGGGARRMGGGDKPLLTVGDQTMLASVIAALDLPHTAISANGDPARSRRSACRSCPTARFAARDRWRASWPGWSGRPRWA
jgi:molybdopterin-guanine dinucleotide biosynthesis protein A